MAVFGGWRLTRAGILFVIGILVLGGLVTGGIFLVKNHGEAVRRDEAVKVAEQNLKDKSEVESKPIATSTPDDSSTNSANNGGSAAETTTPPATTPATSELPQTGPADGLMNTLIVAMLALSVGFYVSSRRARHTL